MPTPDAVEGQIRPAVEADIPALYVLADACRTDMLSRGIGQWVAGYPTEDHVAEAVRRHATWALDRAGEILASVVLDHRYPEAYAAVQWSRPLGAKTLYVHRLCVLPAYHRRGLARRMMAFAEAMARGEGCLCLRLDTHADNLPAQQLYARLGYTKTGTVEFPLRRKHFICMEKLLN